MSGLSTFQSGPKGPKRVQNGQPRCFWPLGTLVDLIGPFQTIQMIFCSKAPPPNPTLFLWGNKLIFVWNGPKVSRWAQRGPKLSTTKTSRFTISDPFGPLWTTLKCWQACHVWPFLAQNGPYLGNPQSWTLDPKVKKKIQHQVSYVWPASDARDCQNQLSPPYFD